jgi:hypothetical protein
VDGRRRSEYRRHLPGAFGGIHEEGRVMEPDYRKFTLPKGKRRKKSKQDSIYTNTRLRLAMTLEAHALGMNLTDYMEYIGYEPAQTRVDPKGSELPSEPILCGEEQGQDEWSDD